MDISAIEGNELGTVAFVQDFLELNFSGPELTLYTWPTIFLSEGSYDFGEPGYRDALCSQIGVNVTTATLEPGIAMEIAFENDVTLRCSLRSEDYEGSEAGQFYSGNDGDSAVEF